MRAPGGRFRPATAIKDKPKNREVRVSQSKTNANISEIDGPYYPVRLSWIPRAGELIDLWSFIDQRAGDQPVHRYEVVQVVHKIHDIDPSKPDAEGAHFVTVHVRPAGSPFFEG
jgi:hypothetical protein